MKNVRVSFTLLVAGCASAQAGPAPEAEQPAEVLMPDVRPTGGAGNLRYTMEEGGTARQLEVAPETAWPHLLEAYALLELVPSVVDPETFRVAVADLTIVRRLAGERLSRIVSCGMTMTGPMADAARVTLQIRSQLYEEPEGRSTLDTRIEAVAIPNDAAGGGGRPCTSRHRLERRIADLVLEGLGGGG